MFKQRMPQMLVHWMVGILLAVATLPPLGLAILRVSVSDATLGRWTQTLLNRNLPGHFDIPRLAWTWPLGMTLHDVTVDDPDGMTAIRVKRVHGRINPWALLVASVRISEVQVEGAWVSVSQKETGAPVNLEATFEPEPHGPPPHEPMAVTLRIDDITVNDSELHVAVPGATMAFKQITVTNGRLWLDKSCTLGVDTDAQVQAQLRIGHTTYAIGRVTVHAEAAQLYFADGRRDTTAGELRVDMPGVQMNAHGAMKARLDAVEGFGVHANMVMRPYGLALIPMAIRQHVHGAATVRLDVEGDGQRQAFKIRGDSGTLAMHDILVRQLQVDGAFTGASLTLRRAFVNTSAGSAAATGTVRLLADGVGDHNVQLQLEDVPLRHLVDPHINVGIAVPEHLQAEVTLKGQRLWPLNSHADVVLKGRGIAAAVLPGVPDAIELHGRLQLRPDGAHIEALGLQGEGVDIAVHGDLPWKPDSWAHVLFGFKSLSRGRLQRLLQVPLG